MQQANSQFDLVQRKCIDAYKIILAPYQGHLVDLQVFWPDNT